MKKSGQYWTGLVLCITGSVLEIANIFVVYGCLLMVIGFILYYFNRTVPRRQVKPATIITTRTRQITYFWRLIFLGLICLVIIGIPLLKWGLPPRHKLLTAILTLPIGAALFFVIVTGFKQISNVKKLDSEVAEGDEKSNQPQQSSRFFGVIAAGILLLTIAGASFADVFSHSPGRILMVATIILVGSTLAYVLGKIR